MLGCISFVQDQEPSVWRQAGGTAKCSDTGKNGLNRTGNKPNHGLLFLFFPQSS
jgi:hypothetical protein